LFVYILDGTLTIDMEQHGTHTFKAGDGLAEIVCRPNAAVRECLQCFRSKVGASKAAGGWATDWNSKTSACHGGGCKVRGQCPDGAHLRRRGAEQSGGQSAAQRRTGEEDLGDAAFSGSAKPPQPHSRSEHRSAPSPQARAAQLSPGRALPSGLARSVLACAKRTTNGSNVATLATRVLPCTNLRTLVGPRHQIRRQAEL